MVSGRIKVRVGFCVMVIRKLSPEQKDLSQRPLMFTPLPMWSWSGGSDKSQGAGSTVLCSGRTTGSVQVYNSREGRSACGSVGLLHSYSPGLLQMAGFPQKPQSGMSQVFLWACIPFGQIMASHPARCCPILFCLPWDTKIFTLGISVNSKNIVSMYLQNYNIPYIFPKTYGLGYSQTLRKGGQRRRLWVKICRLSLGLTTAGGEEGLAQFLCCFSQAPAGQPAPWGDSLMSRREWGSGSATSGCPRSKAWQVTQSVFSFPLCIMEIVTALSPRIFMRLKQVTLLRCFEPCLKISTLLLY